MLPADTPHICFVAPNAYPLLAGDYTEQVLGGAELQQVILARELIARDYRVSIICLDFGQKDDLEIDGITVRKTYRLNAGFPILRFFYPRLVQIWSALKRADADIYYTRTASMIVGIVAMFGKIYNKKTIFAAADNLDFSRSNSRIRLRRDRWIYNYGVRNSSTILAQNERQQELCERTFHRMASIIPNCYTMPGGRPSKTRNTVLWVSTIRSMKRPDRLIEIASQLPNRKFVMVGGPDRYESALFESIKKRAETHANIEFAGFVPYSQIGQYFDDAHILVNTSESEGFPNTFLQSWARAIPTISFVDCGAHLGNERIGYLVNSVPEVVELIENLFADDKEYLRAGKSSYEYCKDNHSTESVINKYKELIEDLLRC